MKIMLHVSAAIIAFILWGTVLVCGWYGYASSVPVPAYCIEESVMFSGVFYILLVRLLNALQTDR